MTPAQIEAEARREMQNRRDKIAQMEEEIVQLTVSLHIKDYETLAEYVGKLGVVR